MTSSFNRLLLGSICVLSACSANSLEEVETSGSARTATASAVDQSGSGASQYLDDVAESCRQPGVPAVFDTFFACAYSVDPGFQSRLMSGIPYATLEQSQRDLVLAYTRLALDYSPSAYAIQPALKHMLMNAVEIADQNLLRELSKVVFLRFYQALPRVEYDLFYAFDLDDVVQRIIERADEQTRQYLGVNHYFKWRPHFYAGIFARALLVRDPVTRADRLQADLDRYRDELKRRGSQVIIVRETLCFPNEFSYDVWEDLYDSDRLEQPPEAPATGFRCDEI